MLGRILHVDDLCCMKLKIFLITGILITIFVFGSKAQGYNTGFGVRLGYDNGLALKYFLESYNAAEFVFSVSPHYSQLTGLYEYQNALPEVFGLYWYIGFGAHIGSLYNKKHTEGNRLLIGPDLIGGLEYIFPQVPISVSLDWKPSFNFTNKYNDTWFYPFALSLRYTIFK